MSAHVEEWRPVPGYLGEYEVSDLGRVRSSSRIVEMRPGVWRPQRGRVLSLNRHGRGYLWARLYSRGTPRNIAVHRLVYETFVGPIADGMQIDHLDFNPSNNRLSNLKPATPFENTARSNRAGRKAILHSERNGMARLSAETVGMIRDAYAHGGASQRAVARRFGVSQSRVSEIVNGKSWPVGRVGKGELAVLTLPEAEGRAA